MREWLATKVAWWLPRRVAYWATVRVGVEATQGKYSSTEVPALLLCDALQRWEA